MMQLAVRRSISLGRTILKQQHGDSVTRKRVASIFTNQGITIRSNSSTGRRHYERKLFDHPVDVLFDVVSDVDRYQEFVPWCQNSRVLTKIDNKMTAELVVGFNVFSESYVSNIEVKEPSLITAVSADTLLFQHLHTEWKFVPANNPSKTWVSLQVDFEFKSSLYNGVAKTFLREVIGKMVPAFEGQCNVVSSERQRQQT
mmetsp:Transcript_2294/g.3617  ORF Transcript_2294/g.3617 Transcript_2294/m.3617 type:complete len:200 (+) Transcript_2294:127-726(+)